MADVSILSPEKLRKLIAYNPETGVLTWLPRTLETWPGTLLRRPEWQCNNWNAAHANQPITHKNRSGYVKLQIKRKQYRGHRVAWAIYFGEWPNGHIDHINGIRDDNRLCNLRIVNDVGNSRNAKLPTTNTSGRVGVSLVKATGKWQASIGNGGKSVHLGFFRTIDEAIACRIGAERALGYHPRHGQSL